MSSSSTGTDDYASVMRFIQGHAAEATRLYGPASAAAVRIHVSLSRAVGRFERDLEEHVQRVAGIGLSAYRILYTLLTLGPRQPAELAAVIGLTRASVSSLLRGLEAKALITRDRTDDDRRQRLVELTDAGRRVVLVAGEASIARQLQWFACYEEAEREALEVLLHRLLAWQPDAVPRPELAAPL